MLVFEILNGAFSSNREIPLRFQLLVELPDDLIGLAAADAHDFSDFCCGDVLSFHKTPLPFLTAVREMCTFHTSVFALIIEMRIKSAYSLYEYEVHLSRHKRIKI